MDDKERLEEIKGRYMEFEYDFNLRKEDIEWLIEQAGRVQELKNRIADDEHFVAEILEQNKRYREALEKITNDEYIQDYCEEIGCYEYEAMWDIAYIALREWEKNEMR